MFRVHSLLLLFTALILSACQEGGMACYDAKNYLILNYLTTSDVDSVQFYLNGEQICQGDEESFFGPDWNYTYRHKICRLSLESELFECVLQTETSLDSCLVSEEYPRWAYYECLYHNEDKVGEASLDLSLQVFSGTNVDTVNIQAGILGGFRYNVIPEQDTSRWYGYTASIVDYADISEKWHRFGCSDDYCVAGFQIVQRDFCYEE